MCIAETMLLWSMMKFAFLNFEISVDDLFGREYLREPNKADLLRQINSNVNIGFSGMSGRIDCLLSSTEKSATPRGAGNIKVK